MASRSYTKFSPTVASYGDPHPQPDKVNHSSTSAATNTHPLSYASMAQHPDSPESTWSSTPLTIEELHQHDLSYTSIECDSLRQDIDPSAVPNWLESSLESLGVDLPPSIKDMIIENDVARLYTEYFVPSRTSFGPGTTVQLVLNHQSNGNCYSYSTSSVALHQGTTDTKVRSEAQVSTVGRSLNSEEEHSFQLSAVEPTAIDWGYSLEGIGAQFSNSGYEEQVFCLG